MIDLSQRLSGALFGSLIGDALALGPHWIYDQKEIADRFGQLKDFASPATAYHPGKIAGSQTHYGDQALILLETIQSLGGSFDPEAFAQRWANFWGQSKSYRDHATKMTLANMEESPALLEAGSDSLELGGAARLAPLLVAGHDWPMDQLIAAARAQTAITHPAAEVQDAAEFITRLVRNLWAGQTLAPALSEAAAVAYPALPVRRYLEEAEALRGQETLSALEEIGLSCPLDKALPAVLFLLLQQGDNLEKALTLNALAGGDSAARGLVLGTVLGAQHGYPAIPERWVQELQARAVLEKFLLGLKIKIDA